MHASTLISGAALAAVASAYITTVTTVTVSGATVTVPVGISSSKTIKHAGATYTATGVTVASAVVFVEDSKLIIASGDKDNRVVSSQSLEGLQNSKITIDGVTIDDGVIQDGSSGGIPVSKLPGADGAGSSKGKASASSGKAGSDSTSTAGASSSSSSTKDSAAAKGFEGVGFAALAGVGVLAAVFACA